MKIFLRFLSVITAFSLLVGLSSCSGGSENDSASSGGDIDTAISESFENVSQNKNFKLPYSKNEPLNPYKTEDLVNLQLSELLYDSLFFLGSDYKPKALIAQKYTFEGLKIIVELNVGLKFCDSTPLSADDIVYSFNLAKASKVFSNRLSSFLSAVKTSPFSVEFSLNRPNPFAVNCLTFPIIKKDDSGDFPTGSGRYYYSDLNTSPELIANETRLGGFSPIFKKISLIHVQDSKALGFSLQIGNIDFAYSDLREGQYRRINANVVGAELNNLVYMAFNSSDSLLRNAQIRQAIGQLIDINSLAENAFQGHAVPTFTPFNPAFYKDESFEYRRNAAKAEELFKATGLIEKDASGNLISGAKKIRLRLLVNSDSPFKKDAAGRIAEFLTQAGFTVDTLALPFSEYESAVKAGNYDLYIGEVALTQDMDLSPLLKPGGSVSYGIDTYSGASSTAYSEFLDSVIETDSFVKTFNDDLPFVPLCYRKAVVAYSRDLKKPVSCDSLGLFCEIESWHF
ncbi:MAG TPA: ABC transporter substrate-binding protein [Clostridiales bacterium]|nr:ABC transporter substrate-binding protein [Clostridiales bacterium]